MAYDSSTYVEIKGSAQSQPSADAGPVARARPEASPSAAPEIDPLTLTTPRERLLYLRDFLRGLPADKFSMRDWFTREGKAVILRDSRASAGELAHQCGTAACIAGWTCAVFRPATTDAPYGAARTLLGLTDLQGEALFVPDGFATEGFAAHQAATVLTHLLNTGEVDWSVARKVEA